MKNYNYNYADQYLRSVSVKHIALQIIVLFLFSIPYGYAWSSDLDSFTWSTLLASTFCIFLTFTIPSYLTLLAAKKDACFEPSYFAQAGMLFSIPTGAVITTLLLFLFKEHSVFITLVMGSICGGLGGAAVGTLCTMIYWGLFISRNAKIVGGIIGGWLSTVTLLLMV